MPQRSIILGIILTLLGIVGYVMSDGASWTALIPALFGILFVVAGALGRNERLRKHAMHGAAALALIGILGSFGGLMKLFAMMGGAEQSRPAAVYAQSIMALLCLGFLIMSIKSFIDARKQRAAWHLPFAGLMWMPGDLFHP